jgi:hypothetical protein
MLNVTWIDLGREPRLTPDPAYPDGRDIDLSQGRKSCTTALPYPARRCGYYLLTCASCGLRAVVTTAGRSDDPRHAKLACKTN